MDFRTLFINDFALDYYRLGSIRTAFAATILFVIACACPRAAFAQAGSLTGDVYSFGQTSSSQEFLTAAQTQAAISNMTPTGTFTGTEAKLASGYSGSDTSTITSVLGTNAASYVGSNFVVDTYVMTFTGYISGSGTQMFSMTDDDGAFLYINGTQVLSNPGDHSASTVSGSYTFNSSTPVSIEVLYYNNYRSAGGGVTQLSLNLDGDPVFPVVPEPSGLTGLLVGSLATVILLFKLFKVSSGSFSPRRLLFRRLDLLHG